MNLRQAFDPRDRPAGDLIWEGVRVRVDDLHGTTIHARRGGVKPVLCLDTTPVFN